MIIEQATHVAKRTSFQQNIGQNRVIDIDSQLQDFVLCFVERRVSMPLCCLSNGPHHKVIRIMTLHEISMNSAVSLC
jgi:hypothetical protein